VLHASGRTMNADDATTRSEVRIAADPMTLSAPELTTTNPGAHRHGM
jgi:hypothetical protein